MGFVSSAVIAYLIIQTKKINIYFISLILFFCFLIINYSLTIFISIIICLTLLLIFYLKKFLQYQIILISALVLSSIYLTNINTAALDKISGLISLKNWQLHNSFDSKVNIKNNELKNNAKNKKVVNLSSEVYIVSLNIAKLAVIEKPFGYGINNYHLAFNKYINDINVTNKITKRLNIHDASNNFAKLIVEFGVFSIFIFIAIFYFFSQKCLY